MGKTPQIRRESPNSTVFTYAAYAPLNLVLVCSTRSPNARFYIRNKKRTKENAVCKPIALFLCSQVGSRDVLGLRAQKNRGANHW